MSNQELSIVLALARCGLAHEPPSAAFVHQLRRLEKALSPPDAEKFKTLLAWHDTGREKSTVEVVLSEAAQLAASADLVRRLLADHQRVEPHHADQCALCREAQGAIEGRPAPSNSHQIAVKQPAQGERQPVGIVRHFVYEGIARNGPSVEVTLFDGVNLSDGTHLYTS